MPAGFQYSSDDGKDGYFGEVSKGTSTDNNIRDGDTVRFRVLTVRTDSKKLLAIGTMVGKCLGKRL